MEAADGWLVRIRPWSSRISPRQLKGIAIIAQTYGNGLIHVSSRGNFQLRGLSLKQHPQVIEDLHNLGLLDPHPSIEAQRNILVSPFDDPEGERLADTLNAYLPHLPALPPKFGFSIDTGPCRYLSTASSDVRIERSSTGRLMVRADGATCGRTIASSDPVTHTASPDSIMEAVNELCCWFVEQADNTSGKKRMRNLLAQGHALPPLLAGTDTPAPTGSIPDVGPIPDSRSVLATQPAPQPVGTQSTNGETTWSRGAKPRGWGARQAPALANRCIIGITWGLTSAEVIQQIAELEGLEKIYTTPWRKMILQGLDPHSKGWRSLITHPDIIYQTGDPRMRIAACVGAPHCSEGYQATRELAHQLVPLLRQHHSPLTVHISGCSKGCASPTTPSTVTVVGTRHGFDWIENGQAHNPPHQTNIDPYEAMLTYSKDHLN